MNKKIEKKDVNKQMREIKVKLEENIELNI